MKRNPIIEDVNTEDSVMAPQNSDFRKHSRNSLESAAGEAQEQVSEQRSVKQALNSKLQAMPANTENILKNRRIVGNRQMWKRQENS